MSRLAWYLAPALISFCVLESPGQGVVVVGGASANFARGRVGNTASYSANSSFRYGYARYGYPYPAYAPAYVGPSVNVYYLGQPAVLGQSTVLIPSRAALDDDLPAVPPRRLADAGPNLPMPREDVIRPPQPRAPDKPEPQTALPDNKPAPRPPAVPEAVDESVLIKTGREAFAAGEDGRSADYFRRAVTAAPNDPLPRFLLTQTLIALGKYAEATDVTREAAERFPNWPHVQYRPLDLYGSRPNDYQEHRRRLDEILAAHPNDPVLQFLSGHLAWFDGRKDEARALLRRAQASFPVAERYTDREPN